MCFIRGVNFTCGALMWCSASEPRLFCSSFQEITWAGRRTGLVACTCTPRCLSGQGRAALESFSEPISSSTQGTSATSTMVSLPHAQARAAHMVCVYKHNIHIGFTLVSIG
jgi:hypothetical protein